MAILDRNDYAITKIKMYKTPKYLVKYPPNLNFFVTCAKIKTYEKFTFFSGNDPTIFSENRVLLRTREKHFANSKIGNENVTKTEKKTCGQYYI